MQGDDRGLADTLIGDRYRIEGLIGRGGMASVYRARDESLGRMVALKLFDRNAADADALRRETSEIRLLASLNHHALVTLFDANVEGDQSHQRAYLAMELVDGPTLQARIERGPVAETDVAAMAADLAEALHVVHAQGVVHRDVKPANILLAPSPVSNREFRAKLADFGIAHLVDSTRLTTPGTIVGTAAYVSPEQARGEGPGAPTDIYALGLVLLETLTGTRAFPGSMVESLGARLMRDPAIPTSLGKDWVALLSRMTALDQATRPTAIEVAEAAHQIERSAGAMLDSSDTRAFTVAQDAAEPTRQEAATLMTAGSTETLGSGATEALGSPAPSANTARIEAAGDPRTEVMGNEPEPLARRPVNARRTVSPRLVIAVIGALAIVALVIVVVVWTRTSTVTPPTADLPAVGGQLGTHLRQLLESVSR
ncbi:MAG TPA: serine/threonine protein kinase [Microbacteriaceae bacterium]|jgi:serine/threonine protein kinase|nr:serine/threonine protein kinase [Microbacteriaceae bacterium]